MKKNSFIFLAFIACILFFTGCKKEEYVATFHPNGGKGDIVTQTFTQKIAQPLMANPFKNMGYTFTGWNTAPDGTAIKYDDYEKVIVSENMVLYAQWAPATGEFTITFNANGGEGNMEPQIFEAGEPQALFKNLFSCEGYSFTCWCKAPNGSGKKFDDEQIITITTDITLFAQWKKNPY